jgi:hypothetical protein
VRRPIEVATVLLALLGAAAGNAYGQGVGQAAPEQFVLSGVVVFDGGGGLAWLQEPTLTQNRVIALRPGESIGSYRLEKIRDDRVELAGPGGTVLVPLYSTAPAAVASAAAPGPARPSPAPARSGPAAPSEAGAEPAVKPDRAERQAERRRLEQVFEKRAAARKGAEAGPQPEAPSPNNPPTDKGSADKLSAGNPFQNNPNVLFLPRGDPRRSQGFQSFKGSK